MNRFYRTGIIMAPGLILAGVMFIHPDLFTGLAVAILAVSTSAGIAKVIK